MKKIGLPIVLICLSFTVIKAQVSYKQNFLSVFSKQPKINNCEDTYNFLCCKSDMCNVFRKTRESLVKANEELTTMQVTVNNSVKDSNLPMNEVDGKKLAEKLENMSQEEKVQWAMQNAANMMPSTEVRANKDMNNKKVNDAVQYIRKLQGDDMQNINALANCAKKLDAIENKYKVQKDAVLKKFQEKTGTVHDPSVSSVYVFGEASDQEVAKFNKAVEEYKKEVLPIYNNELKEKLNHVLQEEKAFESKYMKVEEKLASTNYSEDAQEQVNKVHLIMAHKSVLQQVMGYIDTYNGILSNCADQYAALMNKPSVNKVNKN